MDRRKSVQSKVKKTALDYIGPLHERVLRSSTGNVHNLVLEKEVSVLKKSCDELQILEKTLKKQSDTLSAQKKILMNDLATLKQKTNSMERKFNLDLLILKKEKSTLENEIVTLQRKKEECKRNQFQFSKSGKPEDLTPAQKMTRTSKKQITDKNASNALAMSSKSLNRHDFSDHLIALLEKDFTCCICQELYIDPTVTNCHHVFCSYCLREWRKQNNTCPSCRTSVITEFKVKFVDEYITNFLNEFTDSKGIARLVQRRQIVEGRTQSNKYAK